MGNGAHVECDKTHCSMSRKLQGWHPCIIDVRQFTSHRTWNINVTYRRDPKTEETNELSLIKVLLDSFVEIILHRSYLRRT